MNSKSGEKNKIAKTCLTSCKNVIEFALTFGGQFRMNKLIPLIIPIFLLYPIAGLNSNNPGYFNDEIDLLQETYDYQFNELLRRVKNSENPELLTNLIMSTNTIRDKYITIAPQIKMYDINVANQYTTVVNLLEQLIERGDTNE